MTNRTLSYQGIGVWLICAVFFTYEFLLRTVLGTFQHPIMSELMLTPFSFALLSTTAFVGIYGAMQMPVGFIADRFGLKKSLLLGTSICALSGIVFACTHDLKLAMLIRMLMGLGASFGFICLLVAVYDWMPPKNYGLYIGLSQFIGTMGPMLAAGPFNAMAENGHTQWRSLFLYLGIFGIVLILPILLFVKNNHENIGKFRILTRPTPIKTNLVSILKQKQTWFIALYSALVYFTLEYFSENEGKVFLELKGYSSHFSSYMITIGWFGYAIGCPLLGLLSDGLRRRKIVMVLAAFLSLLAIVLIVYVPVTQWILGLAFFTLGIGAGGQSIGFAIMAEQCNKWYLAAGLGFNNMVIGVFSAVNAPVIGGLISTHSHGPQITQADYLFAFSLITLFTSIALIISLFLIRETYCRSTKEFTLLRK